MKVLAAEFDRLVAAILMRFYSQASHPPVPAQFSRFAAQLRSIIDERGLPCPLADDEGGSPGSLSEAECAPLIARIVNGLEDALLGDAARQFVKACFYPEFKVCRDSFREVARDGACRRQEVSRARSRISGAHCVDCPHWVVLAPQQHAEYLAAEWRGDATIFATHRQLFLPEDFREFRRWLHGAARK